MPTVAPTAEFVSAAYAAAAASATATRDELILQHLPQVRWIAARIHEGLTANVCLDDLVSAGTVGLIAAVDHFDPTLGVKLKTYAEHKIRGAIYDSLRALDWAPYSKRRKAREIEAAIAAAEQRLGRSPSEEEIAAQLDVPLAAYQELLAEAQVQQLGCLEAAIENHQEKHLLAVVEESEDTVPGRALERAELHRVLLEGVNAMPRLERTVLSLYFLEELTLREIAEVVGLRLTRVSQIKSQALLRLRAYLQHYWPTPRGLK